ncbi:MAG: Asp23/Gls24 family envelope stress response protein [Anaerolineae bacterium]|jgi:uncharacterized alkaline shock family protein YloU|nr:Asp23/Gls24 family envelope stress response protein [Anaerolineales bacterium]
MAEDKLGTVRISPEVLATIARLTTLAVPGVASLYHDFTSDVDRFFRGKGGGGGVSIQVVDGAVRVEIGIVAEQDRNLYDLGLEIQGQVSRAIKEMVGMPVLAVNVHVANVTMGIPE